MKAIDIVKPQPRTQAEAFERWANWQQGVFLSAPWTGATKITVTEPAFELFEAGLSDMEQVKCMFRRLLMTNNEDNVEDNVAFLYSLFCENGVTL